MKTTWSPRLRLGGKRERPHLIDAGGHLLHKQTLLLPLADQAGEEGEAVVVGPGGPGGGLGGHVGGGGGRPVKSRGPVVSSAH